MIALASVLLFGATLDMSSYIGGTMSETTRAVAFVESSGCVIIVGHTNANDFPVLNAAQPVSAGGQDTTVTKLDPTGTTILWSTYLGGSLVDTPYAVAVDAVGAVYVAGDTTSANFPTTVGAYQTTSNGGAEAFVVKYSATGAKLWATYLGGGAEDRLRGMGIDGGLAVYVGGFTASFNAPIFPTTAGAFDTTYGGGAFDGYVSKISADGTTLVWSTFLGGNASDKGNGFAVDAAGNAYVTGSTLSADFPLVSAFDTTLGGTDAFVTRVNAGGASLGWSSYLGGSGIDIGQALDLGGGGVVMAGDTQSNDLPAAGSFDPTFNAGTNDAFVARISDVGGSLTWCGYLGGALDDQARALSADATGGAVVGGFTTSTDFPSIGAFDVTQAGPQEGFLASVNPTGTALVWSSLLGGSASDTVLAVSLSANGTRVLAGGVTLSAPFPYPSLPGYDKALTGTGTSDGFFVIASNAGTTAVRVEELEAAREDAAARISWRLADPHSVVEMRVSALENGAERVVAAVAPDPLAGDVYSVTDPGAAQGPWVLDVQLEAGSVERYGPVSLSSGDRAERPAGCGAGDATPFFGLAFLAAFVRARRYQRA